LRPRGPVQLDLAQADHEGETLLQAHGEVDILTAPKLAATLDHIVRTGDGDVAVDLTETVFIDSAGLHVLLNTQRRLTRQDRRFRIICGPGPVRRVIEMARLLEALNVGPRA
jgi:anti-sigma B factor antagonist